MLADGVSEQPSHHCNAQISQVEDSAAEDPEDILNACLGVLYDLIPITHADAGRQLIYTYPKDTISLGFLTDENDAIPLDSPIKLTLIAPYTQTRNWSLHASNIWASAVVLADHVDEISLGHCVSMPPQHSGDDSVLSISLQILELGAGAGLPGLLVAKHIERIECGRRIKGQPMYDWRVTLSDYPDEMLMNGLRANVSRNGFLREQEEGMSQHGAKVHVLPYAWGEDVSAILPPQTSREEPGYDIILAADTLWNAAVHGVFAETLSRLLKPSPGSRIHLVAGLHTGRYAICGFIRALHWTRRELLDGSVMQLLVARIEELEVEGDRRRSWLDSRDEDEAGRRRWVVWLELAWSIPS